jgi:hypothetical protein
VFDFLVLLKYFQIKQQLIDDEKQFCNFYPCGFSGLLDSMANFTASSTNTNPFSIEGFI